MSDMPVIALRPVVDADLDALFDQMRDPESVWMAAFTPDDPDDKSAFEAHMAKVRSSPAITRAVTCDGLLVGSIAAFDSDGEPRSPTGSTAQPGDAASRAERWSCSWT
jgi:RimJ/RimL family protein N-acetyltransferase